MTTSWFSRNSRFVKARSSPIPAGCPIKVCPSHSSSTGIKADFRNALNAPGEQNTLPNTPCPERMKSNAKANPASNMGGIIPLSMLATFTVPETHAAFPLRIRGAIIYFKASLSNKESLSTVTKYSPLPS